MKHIFQQFNGRFLFRAAKCLLLVLFIYKTGDAFACNLAITANPTFPAKISRQQALNTIIYSGKLKWVYSSCRTGRAAFFIILLTGRTTPVSILGVSGLTVTAQSPAVSGLQNLVFIKNTEFGSFWKVDLNTDGLNRIPSAITIEQDITITASNTVVSGTFTSFNSNDPLVDNSVFLGNPFVKGWLQSIVFDDTVTATVTSSPTLPTISTSTCQLSVPNTLTVPTATLNDFVVPGMRGTKLEAKGTSFNIRINCASTSTSFTPTVTFSYGEGFFCMPGNGAPSVTAAKNIGFAIKTSLNGTSISDYICGKSSTIGGTNVVSFPATTANAIYDQSKTFFVNYAIQGSPPSTGFVQANVTVTADFP